MNESTMNNPGIIITIILLLLPILLGIVIMILKVMGTIRQAKDHQQLEDADKLAEYLGNLSKEELDEQLVKRKAALDFQLSHQELSGKLPPEDEKGLLHINQPPGLPIVAAKKKSLTTPQY